MASRSALLRTHPGRSVSMSLAIPGQREAFSGGQKDAGGTLGEPSGEPNRFRPGIGYLMQLAGRKN